LKIRLYAPYSMILGKQDIDVEIPKEGMQVVSMLNALCHRYPVLKDYAQNSREWEEDATCCDLNATITVDNKIAKPHDIIYENSLVKILGPVSGG